MKYWLHFCVYRLWEFGAVEVVNPFLLLDCVQLMTGRDEELPMHMKFLVDNAKHFYGCSKAFKAVIVGVN